MRSNDFCYDWPMPPLEVTSVQTVRPRDAIYASTLRKYVRVYSLARPAWCPPTKAHTRRGTLAGAGVIRSVDIVELRRFNSCVHKWYAYIIFRHLITSIHY